MSEKRKTPKSPKPKNKSTNNLSKEQVLEALRVKRACNAKAQEVVISFIEREVTKEDFLNKLKDINQVHYDDIVEERQIQKYCGYPLCANILKNIPAKKYEINLKAKQCIDLTERKKFCSSHCLNASVHIKKQMLTSPLWLRDIEPIPEFKLLNLND